MGWEALRIDLWNPNRRWFGCAAVCLARVSADWLVHAWRGLIGKVLAVCARVDCTTWYCVVARRTHWLTDWLIAGVGLWVIGTLLESGDSGMYEKIKWPINSAYLMRCFVFIHTAPVLYTVFGLCVCVEVFSFTLLIVCTEVKADGSNCY